jgi:hypothetical protein
VDLCRHDISRTEDVDRKVGPDIVYGCVHTEQPIRVVFQLWVARGVQVATPYPKRSPHYQILQRDLDLLQAIVET